MPPAISSSRQLVSRRSPPVTVVRPRGALPFPISAEQQRQLRSRSRSGSDKVATKVKLIWAILNGFEFSLPHAVHMHIAPSRRSLGSLPSVLSLQSYREKRASQFLRSSLPKRWKRSALGKRC
ncbi:hypothetical protein BT93_G0527 [Corymbia citriodora subsp. variegata]|nr:hypothetical protein BT93_G0527 [Corymbia citriodora subsp. variegata]